MVKHILVFLSVLTITSGFIGCAHQAEEKKTSSDSSSAVKSKSQEGIGRSNFAVIWKWTTDDTEHVNNNSANISMELTKLWKQDVIENAYYNTDSQVNKLSHFPNIAFFLKAKDEGTAKSILDQLTVVTKEIATYTLHPVGQLWLGRKTEVINEKGLTRSFATVWRTVRSPLHGENADDLLKQQNDTMIELWESGVVENVYFDIEGTYTPNNKTDFVFFVNAETETEARQICESLPFFKENMATYQIHQAGVFWMGQYQSS